MVFIGGDAWPFVIYEPFGSPHSDPPDISARPGACTKGSRGEAALTTMDFVPRDGFWFRNTRKRNNSRVPK